MSDPTPASVNQAIGALIGEASAAGHTAGSRISYRQVKYHSLAEASVKVGLSALYSGATVKAQLEASVKSTTTTIMASYTQQMFTASMVLPQTPGDVFSDAFTEDILQQQIDLGRIGQDNLPVFVSSIVYGRQFVFTLTAEGTEAELKEALSIAAGDIGGELSSDQQAMLNTSTVTLLQVGGESTDADKDLIRGGDFTTLFEEETDLSTAKPLSYTVRNLADNVTARVSETTDYNVRECAAPAATGRKYNVEVLSVTYAKRDTRLWRAAVCVPSFHKITSSSLWIEDDYLPAHHAVDEGITGGTTLNIGEQYNYPPNVGPQFKLHFAGDMANDLVRIYGDIRTLGVNSGAVPWRFPFDLRWKNEIPNGVYAFQSWNRGIAGVGADCWRMDLRVRITRLGDIND